MLILGTTTKSLEVLLDAVPSAQLPWTASWADVTMAAFTPGSADGVTNSSTPVTMVAAPAASTYRKLQYLSLCNIASASRVVTVCLNSGGTCRPIIKVTLAPGEQLQFTDAAGFYVLDVQGAIKTAAATLNAVTALTTVESAPTQSVLYSALAAPGTAFQLVSQTAYFVYLGRVTRRITSLYKAQLYLCAVGAGAQTFETGLFSSPVAPNGAGQTLTKLVAVTTIADLTSGLGVKQSGTFANPGINPHAHLWVGCRSQMATTQPQIAGLMYDNQRGELLELAAAGTFAATSTFAAILTAAQTGASMQVCAPSLTMTVL